MNLLQVVLCVVLGLQGGGAQNDFYSGHYHQITSYKSETTYGNPTLVAAKPFNATKDATALKTAFELRMDNIGQFVFYPKNHLKEKIDEAAIVNIMSHRTYEQRDKIAQAYAKMYHKNLARDLISDIDDPVSVSYATVIAYLMVPVGDLLGRDLHWTFVSKNKVDAADVMEVLLFLSNEGIRQVNTYYKMIFKKTVAKSVEDRISGNIKTLILALLKADRDEGMVVHDATADAQALSSLSKKKWISSVATLSAIFSKRSFRQLRHVFAEFKKIEGKDIETALTNMDDRDFKQGLLGIARRANGATGYYAGVLKAQRSVESVSRLIVARCEIDLADIKKEYQKKYGSTVNKLIKNLQTSDANHIRVLQALIGRK